MAEENLNKEIAAPAALEIKAEAKKEEQKPELLNPNKPPLALVKDVEKLQKVYSHADLEGIYRLKIGKRKGLDVWIVDGAKIRKELYTGFVYGGHDKAYKFIPVGEVWIDNAISVEELEFTLIHEIVEREIMETKGLNYDEAHEVANQEELKTRINKTESIDELRERWYKAQEVDGKQENSVTK